MMAKENASRAACGKICGGRDGCAKAGDFATFFAQNGFLVIGFKTEFARDVCAGRTANVSANVSKHRFYFENFHNFFFCCKIVLVIDGKITTETRRYAVKLIDASRVYQV